MMRVIHLPHQQEKRQFLIGRYDIVVTSRKKRIILQLGLNPEIPTIHTKKQKDFWKRK
jgi:hypothetical protein